MEFSWPGPLEQRCIGHAFSATIAVRCDFHWLDALQHLEDQSAILAQQLAAAEGAGTLPVAPSPP